MSDLCQLPPEVLETIWCSPLLDASDIATLAAVCSHFKDVSGRSSIWRCKFRQRWPEMYSFLVSQAQHYDWKDAYLNYYRCHVTIHRKVKTLSPKFYKFHDPIPDSTLADIKNVLNENAELNSLFATDVLLQLIHDRCPNDNLTEKYYAHRVIRFTAHPCIEQLLMKYLQLPVAEQLPEQAALLVVRWMRPATPLSSQVLECPVRAQLAWLSGVAVERLRHTHPRHPLSYGDNPFVSSGALSAVARVAATADKRQGCEAFRKVMHNVTAFPLRDREWGSVPQLTPAHTEQALEAVIYAIFTVADMKGNAWGSETYDNLFIDKVLESGVGGSLVLSVIVAAVARRVGAAVQLCDDCRSVTWDERGDPSGLRESAVRFAQQPRTKEDDDDDDDVEYTLINVLKNGQLESGVESITWGGPGMRPLILNLILNLVHRIQCLSQASELGASPIKDGVTDCCKLQYCLRDRSEPDPKEKLNFLLNLRYRRNLDETLQYFESIGSAGDRGRESALRDFEEQQQRLSEPIVPRRRTCVDVVYSVGLVCRHVRYHYTCVIRGWDEVCKARVGWQQQMGVHLLPHGSLQPFYKVLVEDRSDRYAAQENLVPHTTPCLVPHPEVGRYFHSFTGSHYEPNAELRAQYPDDQHGGAHESMITRM